MHWDNFRASWGKQVCHADPRTLMYAVALLTSALAPAAADEIRSFENVPGWGLVVDPVGDCTFRLADGKFTITIPGTYHDLWPVKGEVNAPLVLEDVEGDFAVQVKVLSVEKAERGSAIPGLRSAAAFHAATLVIWQDAKNFVRFDRTDMNNAGRAITSCYLHVFNDGQRVAEISAVVPDKPTHLRLARRGDRLRADYSQDDGQSWRSVAQQSVNLPSRVKVGISGLNNTHTRNTAQFEGLTITKIDGAQPDEP